MELSIVIPVYNEEQVIPQLYARLLDLFKEFDARFGIPSHAIEVILVNDGSRDNSLPILVGLTSQHDSFKVLNLSKNFGHQIAVTAGIEYAEGNSVVLLDADLQDPPEFILDLYQKHKEGYEVVYAVRKQRRGESFFKRITAKLFYRLMRLMTKIDIPVDTGDFRIMSRKVVDVLKSMREKHRFLRGMITWIGFKQIGLPYERNERFAGKSKYPLRKMIKFAWDGITSFSSTPLRTVSYLGIFIAFLAFLYSLYVVYVKIYTDETISGWSSLMIVVLLMSGLNLITLGMIGEYIGRLSEESKNRPLYIVEKIYKKS
jgi:polyisoprenyl-phosphate glycosyltransferase